MHAPIPRLRAFDTPFLRLFATAAALALPPAALTAQGPPRLLGWNDLGMHCMDNDTSVFSILPPFNTFHAQLVQNGNLVQSGAYTVTYEAVADPNGSINKSSIGKTDFWQHAQALFGVNLPLDQGLAGFRMPGAGNVPQAMAWQAGISDWKAEGVPVTPYDDAGAMNPYPMMRLTARSPQGAVLATTDIVTPVSAEMACVSCHGSGQNPAARPPSGWVFGPAAIDDRLNIVKLHDEHHLGEPLYTASLSGAGYSAQGLLHSVVQDQTPVLCAACHSSIALNAPGQPGVSAMTSAMHTLHGQARLADGRTLDSVQDRSSCYTCHPGAATRCLRGAMGKAIGADGKEMISCQDCHGSMSEVGDPARTGWLEEPNCQACHSGDAVQNAGQIRFGNVFDAPGHMRVPTNQRFATQPDAPQSPFSLYRFSAGHGEMECSACHGSPHAIWPSSEDNDNQQSLLVQGHVGTINECSTCHSNLQDNEWEGPHGMHPTGSWWVNRHQDIAETQGTAGCATCHGTNFRGTPLSRAQADRTITTQFGTRTFFRGFEVGCYECHNGANNDNGNNNARPVVASRNEATPTDVPLQLTLTGSDANGDALTLRIVSQPKHGTVAFDGSTAVYRAWDDYVGTDTFTYTAKDHKNDGNLGTVTIAVGARQCLGWSESFGYGCGEGSGVAPTLSLDGCPSGGNTVTFEIGQLPQVTYAVLAIGTGRGPIEIGVDGCALRMDVLGTIGYSLYTTTGATSAPLTVPPGLGTFALTFQAFALAPAEPRLFVASPGLEVEFH
ncbi:MAG: Ig-like domain-containing protein [Planctomycetes bacterium]|nr:Ig-like domain-containing protein [Planctomycetota bacterium]